MLDQRQTFRAHNFFKKLLDTDKELLVKKGIKVCEPCDGTGLGNIIRLKNGGYSWPDTTSFCDECHGVGFRGLRNLETFDNKKFICGLCEGVGCQKCDQGFTDWISHAMGR